MGLGLFLDEHQRDLSHFDGGVFLQHDNPSGWQYLVVDQDGVVVFQSHDVEGEVSSLVFDVEHGVFAADGSVGCHFDGRCAVAAVASHYVLAAFDGQGYGKVCADDFQFPFSCGKLRSG